MTAVVAVGGSTPAKFWHESEDCPALKQSRWKPITPALIEVRRLKHCSKC